MKNYCTGNTLTSAKKSAVYKKRACQSQDNTAPPLAILLPLFKVSDLMKFFFTLLCFSFDIGANLEEVQGCLILEDLWLVLVELLRH